MHSFTIVEQPGGLTSRNEGFELLNPKLLAYVSEELDLLALDKVLGGVNKQYLSLRHLSLNPAMGLKRLGCSNLEALLEASAYECGFHKGMTRHCIVPLGVLVERGLPGLKDYRDAFDAYAKDGCDSTFLHLVQDSERFNVAAIAPFGEDAPEHFRFAVDRFEQLFLGSGYTLEMLGADNSIMVPRPVGLKLSNGDTLVCYAYREAAGSLYDV